jgi:hypothetical protein
MPLLACIISITLFGCGKKTDPAAGPPSGNSRPAAADAAPIIERYRALDGGGASKVKLRARITESNPGAETRVPPVVEMTIYKKQATDGSKLMLVEFTSPPEERDRDALLRIGSHGEIEAARYAQSSDSFITTNDVMAEESLFGLSRRSLQTGRWRNTTSRL